MTKLPPRKRNRKSEGPVSTFDQLGMSKTRPKKNFKNSIKNNGPSGSPKPTKTTSLKGQSTQTKKKENKGYNPAKTKNRKKMIGRRARPDIPKKNIILKKKRYRSSKEKHQKLMKKFSHKVKETPKAKKDINVDPTQLINLKMVSGCVA